MVDKGFFAQNLAELLNVCEQLLETNQHVLLVFTFKGLFQELYSFYDSPPTTVDKATALTVGLKDRILKLLNSVGTVDSSSLEELLTAYLSNKGKLKARS